MIERETALAMLRGHECLACHVCLGTRIYPPCPKCEGLRVVLAALALPAGAASPPGGGGSVCSGCGARWEAPLGDGTWKTTVCVKCQDHRAEVREAREAGRRAGLEEAAAFLEARPYASEGVYYSRKGDARLIREQALAAAPPPPGTAPTPGVKISMLCPIVVRHGGHCVLPEGHEPPCDIRWAPRLGDLRSVPAAEASAEHTEQCKEGALDVHCAACLAEDAAAVPAKDTPARACSFGPDHVCRPWKLAPDLTWVCAVCGCAAPPVVPGSGDPIRVACPSCDAPGFTRAELRLHRCAAPQDTHPKEKP